MELELLWAWEETQSAEAAEIRNEGLILWLHILTVTRTMGLKTLSLTLIHINWEEDFVFVSLHEWPVFHLGFLDKQTRLVWVSSDVGLRGAKWQNPNYTKFEILTTHRSSCQVRSIPKSGILLTVLRNGASHVNTHGLCWALIWSRSIMWQASTRVWARY